MHSRKEFLGGVYLCYVQGNSCQWTQEMFQHFSDQHGMVWVGGCGADLLWAPSSFSPGWGHEGLQLEISRDTPNKNACTELLWGEKEIPNKGAQIIVFGKEIPNKRFLHKIIVVTSSSFQCRKGIQFGANSSGCCPCSVTQMSQVCVFSAQLSLFSLTNPTPSRGTSVKIQYRILETVIALRCREGLGLHWEKQLQIWAHLGFSLSLSAFNSWKHVNGFLLSQHQRLPEPLQNLSGVLGAAECLLLLFLPLTEILLPDRTSWTWSLPGERHNIPKKTWQSFSWDCALKEQVQDRREFIWVLN